MIIIRQKKVRDVLQEGNQAGGMISLPQYPGKLILTNNDDGLPIIGLGSGAAYSLIQAHFPAAKESIRIASAYFTASGYKMARRHIPDETKLWILVGKEDGRNVIQTVIEDILDDLRRPEDDLWQAVYDLVQKMKAGDFQIVDARAMEIPFHCKFYLIDEHTVLQGSANFSRRGLIESIEQIGASQEPSQVQVFSQGYWTYYQMATPLTQQLIDLLSQFLELAAPFDIYLKTLLTLNYLPDRSVREGGNLPVYYQKAVVARALRQIDAWGGAVVVAATGLGKTVMGSEIAYHLRSQDKIKRVILLSPAGNVQESWREELDARDLAYSAFTNTILFQENKAKADHHKVNELDRKLSRSDEETLILIDEAHVYRNQLLVPARKGRKSRVIDRINRVVNEKNAKIVMLTATPYSTSNLNLNSLLALLPHKMDSGNMFGDHKAWSVKGTQEFVRLPVCTVIGLPHVLKIARQRGDVDEQGRAYIEFHDKRRYLPRKLSLRAERYSFAIDQEFLRAWQEGCFEQWKLGMSVVAPENASSARDTVRAQVDYIRNASLDAWLSSPVALKAAVMKNLRTEDPPERSGDLWKDHRVRDTAAKSRYTTKSEESADDLFANLEPYNVALKHPLAERQEHLMPLLTGLDASLDDYKNDGKLQTLLKILDQRCKDRRKAIVFACLRLTADYLLTALQELRPNWRVGCTVSGSNLKPILERQRLQRSLAPRANRRPENTDDLDILIMTDADSMGVNLQDADTVISYDLPREADKIIQRVGRVLRPTEDPEREVYLYVLLPYEQGILDHDLRGILNHIQTRIARISRRHENAQHILNAPVMPKLTGGSIRKADDVQEIWLDQEVDVEALLEENGDLVGELTAGVDTSPAIQHQAILEDPQYKQRAQALGDNLHSAGQHDRPESMVYVLVQVQERYETIVYSLSQQRMTKLEETEVLDLIRCESHSERAIVRADQVESLANRVVRKWCKERNAKIEDVRKICALYLKGSHANDGLDILLSGD